MNKVLKNIVNLIKQQKKYKKYKISEATRKAFLGEQWVDATTALIELNNKYKKFDLLSGLFDIKVAKSRLTGLKNDKKILVKELEQSMILADLGYSIYLLPKKKDINSTKHLLDLMKKLKKGVDSQIDDQFTNFLKSGLFK